MPSRKNRIGISSTIASSTKPEDLGQILQEEPPEVQKSEHRALKTKPRKMKEPPIKSKSEDGSREGPAPAEPKLVMVVLRPFGLRILRYSPVPTVNVSVQHLRNIAIKKRHKKEKTHERTPWVRIKKPTDSWLESSNNEALKEWLRNKTALLRRERTIQKEQKKLEQRKEKEMEREKQLRNAESERMVRQWMERKRQEQKMNRMQSSAISPNKPARQRVPPTGRVMATRMSLELVVSETDRADVNKSVPGRRISDPAENTELQKLESDIAQGAEGICETTMKPTKTWFALPGPAPGENSDLCGA
ncbi:reticulocyte-binding protein 2 homolog a-like [Microcaecilia unicolor]|uniref:Reticulocyte-binding protein 2 homolog a-like n=1 Tax=Microcaecilia unicolor TaxID=1415580 RepID=A0A6P7Z135_9AMPH|nr:reticulocyte-binding protein 2 homolog a-like [Microcaecilia unicolor]